MKNTKKITKIKDGRPTKYNEKTVEKIISILQTGGTVEQACAYAKINKTTFYAWVKENEDFSNEVESAKHYLNIASKNVVQQTIIRDKNDTNAKWWLEKTEFKNNTTNNVQVNIMQKIQEQNEKYQD